MLVFSIFLEYNKFTGIKGLFGKERSMKKTKIFILIMGLVILSGCKKQNEITLEPAEAVIQEPAETVIQEQELEDEKADFIYVYVCGAVKEAGVYELRNGSRVYDGIRAAGGLTEEAAGDTVNQARKLLDEEQIYIPTKEEISSANEWDSQEFTMKAQQDLGLININTADEETLCTLPGVGETRAEAIINYRRAHGNFNSIEDIMNVEGIKNGLFSKIESLITVH